jgi:hypothetical protein
VSQIPSLQIEFSFDTGTLREDGTLLNGGSESSLVALFFEGVYPARIDNNDLKVGTGSLFLKMINNGTFSSGITPYVQISSVQTSNSGLSFALWFKSKGNLDWACLFDFGNGAVSDNILMAIYKNNIALDVVKRGIQSNPLNVVSNVNDGVWRHIVWTLDPLGVWKVYLNGALVWQATGYIYPNAITRTSNFLGKSNWAGDPVFNGVMDEFRMYNRVLVASEVQILYSGDAYSSTFGAGNCVSNPTSSPTTRLLPL